jgi:hypothetical protein
MGYTSSESSNAAKGKKGTKKEAAFFQPEPPAPKSPKTANEKSAVSDFKGVSSPKGAPAKGAAAKGPPAKGPPAKGPPATNNPSSDPSSVAAPASAGDTHTDNISGRRLDNPPVGFRMQPPGRGCYLRYSPESQGLLFSQWSEKPITEPGVIAYYEAGKDVPVFKFRGNSGRTQIIKQCCVPGGKNMFEGFMQFCKEAFGQ